jgi:hypothetical protein
MQRRLNQIATLRIALGLVVAIGLLGSRTEKLFVELLGASPVFAVTNLPAHEPFDPRRVPQSGGMASRLLAGITVKL